MDDLERFLELGILYREALADDVSLALEYLLEQDRLAVKMGHSYGL